MTESHAKESDSVLEELIEEPYFDREAYDFEVKRIANIYQQEKESGRQRTIPKTLLQTTENEPPEYILNIIKDRFSGWEYKRFQLRTNNDNEQIYNFFNENPLEEFPDIIDVFNRFERGAHRSDLFRYYYLYLNGGFYLDGDAMIEVNADDIVKDYDSVFVKSFTDQPHDTIHNPNSYEVPMIWNGLIATFPKSPIMYEALKHAYGIGQEEASKKYLWQCEELWNIVSRLSPPNTKMYVEINQLNFAEQGDWGRDHGITDPGSIVVDENYKKIASHWWQNRDYTLPHAMMRSANPTIIIGDSLPLQC